MRIIDPFYFSKLFLKKSIKVTQQKEKIEPLLELDLQKHLAKIIVETKFEFNVSQKCIDQMLIHFETFINASINKIKVSYLQKLVLFPRRIYIHFSL